MKEKEPIKVKLSTVLFIIAIIVIVAIGLIIGVLYNQNINQNVVTNNSENAMIGENVISDNAKKDFYEKSNNTTTNENIKNNKEDNTKNTNYKEVSSSNIEWENYPNDIDKLNDNWLGVDVSNSESYNLMKKTIYSLSQKNDNNFRDIYYNGDSTEIIEWTSNYSRYCYPDNKNNDLSAKYTKKITYDIAVFNEAYYDGYYDLTTSVKRQYEKLNNNEYYYEISKMLVMNGNNESQNDYKNNARAKKIKVIVNKEKEYTFDLNDTNKVQIFDIGYKQNDIKTPINIEVEVLEKYNGEKTNDVYVSDIQFGINSNIPQGR